MKKRILGIALAICMMIFCVPMGVFAAEAPSFSGGTGTQGDPWLIASQADLTALAEFLNSGNAATFDTENAGVGNCHGYYFKQTADIDLTGVTWEPIGYSGKYYFAGNYDGGGHSITNAVSTGKVDPDGYATAGIFGGPLLAPWKNSMEKTQTLWQPVRIITAMWAVLQVCVMVHPSKTARLRTPLWRADATTIITVREALWVIPPAEHLKSALPKTTKLELWLTAVVLSVKWTMTLTMEPAILHLQTAMLQTVL